MQFVLSSLVVLATAALAVAKPQTGPLNPDSNIARRVAHVPQTNAKRFAAGLPPLPPRARPRQLQRGGPRGGTRVDTARRSTSSPLPPVTGKCNILVKNADNGNELGYISPVWNSFGQYGTFQSDQAGALEVSFPYSPDSSEPLYNLNFLATNGPDANYPYVGATIAVGSSPTAVGEGSSDYAYITGTTEISGLTAEKGDNNPFNAAIGVSQAAESSIWQYDPITQAITARWRIRGGGPETYFAYVEGAGDDAFISRTLIQTGNLAETQELLGVPITPVTFTCVPSLEMEPGTPPARRA